MRRPRSLKGRLTWWLGGAMLALYGAGAALGWLYATGTARQLAVVALRNETEALASSLRATGQLDAPELSGVEKDPIPFWLRIVRHGKVVAASPGAPELPPLVGVPSDRVFAVSTVEGPRPLLHVRHLVGPAMPELSVEGIGSLEPLVQRAHRLALRLAIAGLVVIPLAAYGGRRLASRALAPVDHLVAATQRLGPEHLDERLPLSAATVDEVAALVGAFNQLLDRLQQSAQNLSRFAADASHEIRNPLTVLRTGLEVALRRDRSPEEYRELLRGNLREIERLHEVVEGLLAMARASPGAPVARQLAPVELAPLVEETLRRFDAVAAERRIEIVRRLSPDLVVDGDAALLRLIVFNLVDNALKHGPAGAPIDVVLEPADRFASLTVSDAGAGIPAEARQRLFERFYRVEANGENGAGIGGLGLAVSRWVAEGHGGEVTLDTGGPGTRFVVRLPLRPRSA